MDAAKMAFLFGELPEGVDPDDPDERSELMLRDLDTGEPGAAVRAAVRAAIAEQVADDDPPQVWQTAQRLLAAGHDRSDVLSQLALAFTPAVLAAVRDEEPFDRDAYLGALDRLPLPSADDLERAMREVTRVRRSVTADELDELVAEELGLLLGDPAVDLLLDQVSEHLIDQDGPLEMLAGDVVVDVAAATDGIVLTHRLTPAERDTGVLPLDVDLAGFRRRTPLTTPDGAALTVTAEGVQGPPGWLADHPAGALLGVRVVGGVLSCSAVDPEPDLDSGLVSLLRSGYDTAVAEPWLPVPVEELVLHALLDDPTAFTAPAAPLSDLLPAAGLEVRGTQVAHEESVWRAAEQVHRTHRLLDRLGTGDLARDVLHVLELLERDPLDNATARHVLDDLYDPALLEAVMPELLGSEEDPERLPILGALAGRLLKAASQPSQRAVAHWLLAVVAERELRVTEAESELRAATRADPDWLCAVDRLAWYASDRGDAQTALQLWRRVGVAADISADVRLLEPFAAPSGPAPGRNEQCWCGSGRKYKQCHLGRPVLPPLPERVGWLARKATAFLERRGGLPGEAVYAHAAARAVDPDDPAAVEDALEDPLVVDAVLTEGGWFERFLTERGPLLPEDEALLARAWTRVERTVYELVEVRPGTGVAVRDLRTGDVLDVRDRTSSKAARQGDLVCARAVPDGESHQFVGAIFPVDPGRERALLGLLAERDGMALLAWVAALHRPPVLVAHDGPALAPAALAIERRGRLVVPSGDAVLDDDTVRALRDDQP